MSGKSASSDTGWVRVGKRNGENKLLLMDMGGVVYSRYS